MGCFSSIRACCCAIPNCCRSTGSCLKENLCSCWITPDARIADGANKPLVKKLDLAQRINTVALALLLITGFALLCFGMKSPTKLPHPLLGLFVMLGSVGAFAITYCAINHIAEAKGVDLNRVHK
ncbi:MAG: hypothetical protein ACKVOH_02540 [Chlamydiales bacterium]